MNNIIFELKNIVDDGKKEKLSLEIIRVQLKEYLQIFILDFIYNSKFNFLNFYGGSSIRIIYELPRMSEDLDFEAEEGFNLNEFVDELKKYFHSKLLLKDIDVKVDKTGHGVFMISVKLKILSELGLSASRSETNILIVRVDIKSLSKEYFKNMKIISTPLSKYGKNMIIKHYDLPTLMSTKIAAIIQRPNRGYKKGDANYKGRDFYDLLWYMQKGILPNENALKADGIDGSIQEVFNKIAISISKMNLEGIKADLLNLLENLNYVDNWIASFRDTFERLRSTFYVCKKDFKLDNISVEEDMSKDIYTFIFNFLTSKRQIVQFKFKITEEFFMYTNISDINLDNIGIIDLICFRITHHSGSPLDDRKQFLNKYAIFFYEKIRQYLSAHQNDIYFSRWESQLITSNSLSLNAFQQATLEDLVL